MSLLSRAHQVLAACVRGGMSASSGPRYNEMIWMRDLAIVAPAYVKDGFRAELRIAVRALCEAQSTDTSPSYNNGYETFCRYGQVPIVCVPNTDKATCGFLVQRLVGTRDDPYWAWQLYDYCHQSELGQAMDWNTFPLPLPLPVDTPITQECVAEQLTRLPTAIPTTELRKRLVKWYTELHTLEVRLGKDCNKKPPHASFALESYMQGRLADLTAGTRDSELHLVRAMGTLYDAYSDEPQTQLLIWNECAPALCRALIYLFGQVACDADEGLPRGADSRDIYSDMMYDARLLSNACFLHQVLDCLASWSHLLAGNSFLMAVRTHTTDSATAELVSQARTKSTLLNSLFSTTTLSNELNIHQLILHTRDQLADTIRRLFFPPNSPPRDFLPGARATLSFISPIKASPSNHLATKVRNHHHHHHH
jgi:hypothetical protein